MNIKLYDCIIMNDTLTSYKNMNMINITNVNSLRSTSFGGVRPVVAGMRGALMATSRGSIEWQMFGVVLQMNCHKLCIQIETTRDTTMISCMWILKLYHELVSYLILQPGMQVHPANTLIPSRST